MSNVIAPEAAALVKQVVRKIGGTFPIPPRQLAATIPLWLEARAGGPLEVEPRPRGDGYRAALRFNDELPYALQEDSIATGCALWLVSDFGLPLTHETVGYVARELCGTAGVTAGTLKPLISTQGEAPEVSAVRA